MELKVEKLTKLQAIKGLLGEKTVKPIFFRTNFGIHTFFMQIPIDVLILDKEGKIVKKKENMKPNRILLWNPLFDRVIELPYGSIKKLNITTQTKIDLVFV